MKKSVMYSETRTWFFNLDMAEGADLDEVMSVLKGTDRFYRYVDDGTSNGIEGEWSEVPEEWRGEELRSFEQGDSCRMDVLPPTECPTVISC